MQTDMELGGAGEPEEAVPSRIKEMFGIVDDAFPKGDTIPRSQRAEEPPSAPMTPSQNKPQPPATSQKPQGILGGVLSNPKLSKESKTVIESLSKEKKAFTIRAEQYGKAIAESIMLQSQAPMSNKLNFEDEMKKRIELRGGSYALIVKGTLPVRVAPFMWQLDQGTRRSWAVFVFNNFYGHKDPHPLMFWKKIMKVLVLTPFDAGSNMVENFGKGYWVKFDEGSQFQMPVNVQDTIAAERMRVDNKYFISSALTLWVDLQAYTKAKLNMKMIMYLIIGAGVIIFAYWFLHSHPGFMSGILPHI